MDKEMFSEIMSRIDVIGEKVMGGAHQLGLEGIKYLLIQNIGFLVMTIFSTIFFGVLSFKIGRKVKIKITSDKHNLFYGQ